MKRKRSVTIALIPMLLIVGGIASYRLLRPQPLIPPAIRKQVTINVFMPRRNDRAVVDRASFKYDAKLKLLTYVMAIDNVTAVTSEQVEPELFIDVPKLYDKTIDDLQEYAKFDTANGVVYLVRPPQLKGNQAAVINTKGTLIFVKPKTNLTEDQWQKFFNSLEIVP